jgi:hypothetical protein
MNRARLTRLPALAIAGALLASLLTGPAQALPVFTVAEVDAEPSLFDFGNTGCPVHVISATPVVANLPVVENGPAVTASAAISGTLTRTSDPTDAVTVTTNLDATASLTSAAGNPRALAITATGNVATSTTKPVTACQWRGGSDIELVFTFAVSHGGFFSVTTVASPHAIGNGFVTDSTDGGLLAQVVSQGAKGNGVLTVFLPPGSYSGRFFVSARSSNEVVPSTPVSVSVRGTFSVAGSQIGATAGKGATYVALPSLRACESHAVIPTITDKKKRVRQIKRVTFFVNGARVKKVRHPHRGVQIALPVADELRADVRVEVALRPTRKGRPGKVLEGAASYEACS